MHRGGECFICGSETQVDILTRRDIGRTTIKIHGYCEKCRAKEINWNLTVYNNGESTIIKTKTTADIMFENVNGDDLHVNSVVGDKCKYWKVERCRD